MRRDYEILYRDFTGKLIKERLNSKLEMEDMLIIFRKSRQVSRFISCRVIQ